MLLGLDPILGTLCDSPGGIGKTLVGVLSVVLWLLFALCLDGWVLGLLAFLGIDLLGVECAIKYYDNLWEGLTLLMRGLYDLLNTLQIPLVLTIVEEVLLMLIGIFVPEPVLFEETELLLLFLLQDVLKPILYGILDSAVGALTSNLCYNDIQYDINHGGDGKDPYNPLSFLGLFNTVVQDTDFLEVYSS